MWKIFFSLVLMAIEVGYTLYFLDTFLPRKSCLKLEKYRFFIYFAVILAAGSLGTIIGLYKIIPFLLVSTLLGTYFYKATFKNNLFYLALSYCLILLTDWIVLSLEEIWTTSAGIRDGEMNFTIALSAKMLSVLLVLIIRRIWKSPNHNVVIPDREWCLLLSIPVFSIFSVIVMYVFYPDEAIFQGVYLFLSTGLVCINFVVIYLIQSILEKREQLRRNTLANQKAKNQLLAYQEMESAYESQRRKMHDYKNQLVTIQNLLQKNDVDEAILFTEKLTDSIASSTSAINTNHPVVNAVLNHKFHTAQEKHIPMVLKLGDVHEILCEEEELVILLSNLWDNAIRECEKVIAAGKEAVIHFKLVYEDENFVLSIKNTVLHRVEIVGNQVCAKHIENHGIGLLNVRNVVEKYHGELVLSCDDREFKVVVIMGF